jgi:hypothetical protein
MTDCCCTPNATWSQASWFIDPQNISGTASDSNNGNSRTTALLTFCGGMISKLGTCSPILKQNTTITFMSAQTDNSDPIIFNPTMVGGVLVLQGDVLTAQKIGSGSLASVISKNRSTPQLLKADLGASFAVGSLVKNTQSGKTSFAWIYQLVSGTTYLLSQPFTLVTVPVDLATTIPSEVDTWANSDTFEVYKLLKVFLVKVDPVIGEYNSTTVFAPPVQIYHLDTFDFSLQANTSLGSGMSLIETAFSTSLQDQSKNIDESTQWFNVAILSGVNSLTNPLTAVVGGMILCGTEGSTVFYGSIDGDCILDSGTNDIWKLGAPTGEGPTGFATGAPSLGLVYLAGASAHYELEGDVNCVQGYVPNATKIWGPGILNVQGRSRVYYAAGAGKAAATFLIPTILINGRTKANPFNPTNGTWHGEITVTVTSLDAAFSSTGFGGNAINPSGAAITNQATP